MSQEHKSREAKWEDGAKNDTGRPNPVYDSIIPAQFEELDNILFPIPPLRKGWNYPHSSDEYRHSRDSETLNAYLESGWGYGVCCAGDLVVIDIDSVEHIGVVTENLPETCYQITGSRTGVHFFYLIEGVDTRMTLFEKTRPDQPESDREHIGEVKCDPHGYVVGPGSIHPSGNRYGPLHGDEITRIEEDELLNVVDEYRKRDVSKDEKKAIRFKSEGHKNDIHNFYTLTADDVAPHLGYNSRMSNPFHGSSTGSNFMKNEGGETFTCWRCQTGAGDGCTFNGTQFLAAKGIADERADGHCEYVRRNWNRDYTLHFKSWEQAHELGLVDGMEPPYRVIAGFGLERGFIQSEDDIDRHMYYTLSNALEWEQQETHICGG